MSTILSISAWSVNRLNTSITILLVYFNRFRFLKALGRSWLWTSLKVCCWWLGTNTILKIFDHFSKYAHFLWSILFTAPYVVKRVCDSVVKLHGLPKTVVTYCDRIFPTLFWKKLFALMGKKLVYDVTYHPQTDGQNKRVNNAFMTPSRYTIKYVPPCI